MAIKMNKYVDIRSRVGATGGVQRRELILRLFTTSDVASPEAPLEFSSADAVGLVFGAESPEYARAQQYFAYVSPSFTRPSKIAFARDQTSSSVPLTLGGSRNFVIADMKQKKPMRVHVNKSEFVTQDIDLTAQTTLAGIAAQVQAALRALTISGNAERNKLMKECKFTYDAGYRRFVFTGGTNTQDVVTFSTTSVDLYAGMANILAMSAATGATAIAGVGKPTGLVESIDKSIDTSNNFGTFEFMRELTIDDHVAIALANANRNVMFEYVVPVKLDDYEVWAKALMGIEGTTLVLVSDENVEFDDLLPGAIKAAVNYNKRDSAVSYMYRQHEGLSAKVTDTTLSNQLDAVRVNYYGETQTAGQKIDFYQRGLMMGGKSSPVDENIYANEQWLKDDLAAGFLELMLAVGRVSANTAGINKLANTMQQTVDKGVYNGVISVGKELTSKQRAYITETSADEQAWIQVQNIGYWYTVGVEPYLTDDGRTEYKGVYTLIYSKDDAIRKVEGNNILI